MTIELRQVGDPQIARNIRRRRLELDLSQEELADRVGIRQSTLSGYENGTRTPPPNALRGIAKALRVQVAYFFDEQDARDLILEALGPEALQHMTPDRKKALEDLAVAYLRVIAPEGGGRDAS